MQKIAQLDEKINAWQGLETDAKDLLELSKLNDPALEQDLGKQYSELS